MKHALAAEYASGIHAVKPANKFSFTVPGSTLCAIPASCRPQ